MRNNITLPLAFFIIGIIITIAGFGVGIYMQGATTFSVSLSMIGGCFIGAAIAHLVDIFSKN